MNRILGLFLMLMGMGVGLYVGLWWAFVGGIVQIIDAAKAIPTDAVNIALGLLRVLGASLLGTLAGTIVLLIGLKLIEKGNHE